MPVNKNVQQPVNGTVGATDTAYVVKPVDAAGNPVGGTAGGGIGHNITGISDDRKVVATAGTREALAASTPAKYVVITAETDNTGVVVVGGTTVVAALATRRGTPLDPGDTLTLEVDNLNDVNLDSTVSGDGVTFTYLT